MGGGGGLNVGLAGPAALRSCMNMDLITGTVT